MSRFRVTLEAQGADYPRRVDLEAADAEQAEAAAAASSPDWEVVYVVELE